MIEFAKYFIASAFALVVDYSAYWLLSSQNLLSLPVAAVAGYATGLIVAYLLMKDKVFKAGWLKDKQRIEFLMFLASGAFGMLLTYSVVWAVVETIGSKPIIAKTSAVAVSFVGVYLFRKHIVFKRI